MKTLSMFEIINTKQIYLYLSLTAAEFNNSYS